MMHPTRNDLPEATRKAIVDMLNGELANAIDLSLQAKQAHWNVRGPDFYQLHLLFDKVYEATQEFVDLIAERATSLGGVAEGAAEVVTKRTTLPRYPLTIKGGREHVDALSKSLAAFAKIARRAIDQADELRDKDTADLFTEISREVDKQLWFVEAHLHAEN